MDARCGITTLVFEKKIIIDYRLISHKYTSCQIMTFFCIKNNKRIKCVQLTKSKIKTHGKISLSFSNRRNKELIYIHIYL